MAPVKMVLFAVLFVNYAAFYWAILKFFTRPEGKVVLPMKLISIFGMISVFSHLTLIALTPEVPVGRGSVSLALVTVSGALFFWAIRSNNRRRLSLAYSKDQPVHLNQDGPYRFVRHPFYLSYLLTWSGGALACQHWFAWALAATMGVLYWRAARAEERKFSQSALATAYAEYRKHAGLFWPKPSFGRSARDTTPSDRRAA